jgi:hypothetical protein
MQDEKLEEGDVAKGDHYAEDSEQEPVWSDWAISWSEGSAVQIEGKESKVVISLVCLIHSKEQVWLEMGLTFRALTKLWWEIWGLEKVTQLNMFTCK